VGAGFCGVDDVLLVGLGASSGRGFKTLVTRGVALRQLDGHLRSTMPGDGRKPLFRYATDLFDQVCREVRDGVVEFRRRENAILVEPRGGGDPKPKPLDDYAALLIRAVRDSAHGLLAQLRADEARVIGIHLGGLPAEVALLPGPLLLGFAAGAEAFTAANLAKNRLTQVVPAANPSSRLSGIRPRPALLGPKFLSGEGQRDSETFRDHPNVAWCERSVRLARQNPASKPDKTG
jgi:hypothetical protein